MLTLLQQLGAIPLPEQAGNHSPSAASHSHDSHYAHRPTGN